MRYHIRQFKPLFTFKVELFIFLAKCRKMKDLDVLCSSLDEESRYHTLVRQSPQFTRCPILGPRKFTFSTPGGECQDSPSEITSSADYKLEFHHSQCEDSELAGKFTQC